MLSNWWARIASIRGTYRLTKWSLLVRRVAAEMMQKGHYEECAADGGYISSPTALAIRATGQAEMLAAIARDDGFELSTYQQWIAILGEA